MRFFEAHLKIYLVVLVSIIVYTFLTEYKSTSSESVLNVILVYIQVFLCKILKLALICRW